MIGQSITLLVPPERPDEEPAILARLRRGERVDHFETVRIRKDGRRINVSVTISPIKAPNGTIIGASKVVRDISALKRYLAERDQLLASEQAARRESERISRAKDEFLATLSHELRTPLNAILGWATLLRDAASDPEELKQGLEAIERNARTQCRLIDDLLDMSRIISGMLRLEVRPLDLRTIVADSIESVSPAAQAKHIAIRRKFDDDAAIVSGDAARLQQVIWNLLANAIKFTPRGGEIDVQVERVQSHVQLRIADTGQGIAPEFLPNLFARFTQGDASTTRTHGGLGLGLAIVRHLVELHGGSVCGESAGKGRGATFTISLPVAPVLQDKVAPAPPGAFSSERKAPPAIDLDGVKVLVVDDEADSRLLTRKILEGAHASVLCAASAAQALALVREQQPDVLLTDIAMPHEDGYQLISKLRSLEPAQGGKTPAAALTAFARPEDRRHALLTGFQLHIAKPIEPADLLAAVKSLSTCSFFKKDSPSPPAKGNR